MENKVQATEFFDILYKVTRESEVVELVQSLVLPWHCDKPFAQGCQQRFQILEGTHRVGNLTPLHIPCLGLSLQATRYHQDLLPGVQGNRGTVLPHREAK